MRGTFRVQGHVYALQSAGYLAFELNSQARFRQPACVSKIVSKSAKQHRPVDAPVPVGYGSERHNIATLRKAFLFKTFCKPSVYIRVLGISL